MTDLGLTPILLGIILPVSNPPDESPQPANHTKPSLNPALQALYLQTHNNPFKNIRCSAQKFPMFSLKVPDVFKELIRKVFVKPEERKLALCLGEKRLRDEKRFLYHRARARRQFNTSKKK